MTAMVMMMTSLKGQSLNQSLLPPKNRNLNSVLSKRWAKLIRMIRTWMMMDANSKCTEWTSSLDCDHMPFLEPQTNQTVLCNLFWLLDNLGSRAIQTKIGYKVQTQHLWLLPKTDQICLPSALAVHSKIVMAQPHSSCLMEALGELNTRIL